jgi:UDP-N-acetyl-D-mannosaminuronate dehydrogenase
MQCYFPYNNETSADVKRSTAMNVAVLGLGLMGLPMARRLCQAGLAGC